MEKEFYSGQPVIIKATGGQATFVNDDGSGVFSCSVLTKKGGQPYIEFYNPEQLEPSTEFKFSEIMAGLEQDYFEVETEFRVPNDLITITVKQGHNGLCLESPSGSLVLISAFTNTMWTRVEPRKKMTIAEIEAELN